MPSANAADLLVQAGLYFIHLLNPYTDGKLLFYFRVQSLAPKRNTHAKLLGKSYSSWIYMEARMAFINKFSSINMEKPDKWAFQYDEKQFEPGYFPGGEYELIQAEED